MTILLAIAAYFALVAYIVQRNNKAMAKHSAQSGDQELAHLDGELTRQQHQ